jgi:hypothetical protein
MYVKIQMKEMSPLACWLAVSPQAASDKTGATGLTTAPHEPRPPTAPFILPVCFQSWKLKITSNTQKPSTLFVVAYQAREPLIVYTIP